MVEKRIIKINKKASQNKSLFISSKKLQANGSRTLNLKKGETDHKMKRQTNNLMFNDSGISSALPRLNLESGTKQKLKLKPKLPELSLSTQ